MQLAKQIPWWVGETIQDTSTSAFFVTGGQGSGKSHGSAIAFLANVLLNPAVPQWWAVAPTYTQAENTLLPLCVKVLADWFGMTIGNGYTVTRQKPYVLKFPSGQTIYFHSGDRPENMVSATIGGFWITEAGIQKREV
jgi:phage terminase large subunit